MLFAKVITLQKKLNFRRKFEQKAGWQIFFPWHITQLSIINTQLIPFHFFNTIDKLESHAGGPFKWTILYLAPIYLTYCTCALGKSCAIPSIHWQVVFFAPIHCSVYGLWDLRPKSWKFTHFTLCLKLVSAGITCLDDFHWKEHKKQTSSKFDMINLFWTQIFLNFFDLKHNIKSCLKNMFFSLSVSLWLVSQWIVYYRVHFKKGKNIS